MSMYCRYMGKSNWTKNVVYQWSRRKIATTYGAQTSDTVYKSVALPTELNSDRSAKV